MSRASPHGSDVVWVMEPRLHQGPSLERIVVRFSTERRPTFWLLARDRPRLATENTPTHPDAIFFKGDKRDSQLFFCLSEVTGPVAQGREEAPCCHS